MLVYIALLTPVLLLFCGLAVDVGQMEVRRLQLQSASDAAAIGAAQSIERDSTNGSWVSDGQSEAAANGFTNGTANTTVSVAQQPVDGAYAGFYDAVQTTVTQQVPLSFLRLLGTSSKSVSTRSTALVAPCAYLSGAANLANPVLNVTSSVTASSTCPWYINRSASVDSSSNFSALAENVTGPAGSSSWTVGSSSVPRYNAETHTDPLASIVAPTAGSCSATNSITGDTTLSPGTYCRMTTRCSTTCTVTLQPGLYIFAGGLTAVNTVFRGTGFTFYFTKYGSSYGTFSCTSNNSANNNYCLLYGSAPTDASNGGIPGVLLMNDRNWVHTNAQDFTFTGTSSTYSPAGIYADGIVYLTGTGISLSFSYFYCMTHYLAIDADNLAVTNGSLVGLKSDFTQISGGSPFLPQGGLVQ